MKLAVMQPAYLPWLGYFDKLAACDQMVVYDWAQYTKGDFANRNRIRTATEQGWQWLTVPVHCSLSQSYREVTIDYQQVWFRKHLAAIQQAYGKAPYFQPLFDDLCRLLTVRWQSIADLSMWSIKLLCQYFDPSWQHKLQFVPFDKQPKRGNATQKLVTLCQMHSATTYITGVDMASQLDLERFQVAGIEVECRQLGRSRPHPVYPQLHGEFIPAMSAVDLLMNCGSESAGVLMKKRQDISAARKLI